jgi:hypothetical protein
MEVMAAIFLTSMVITFAVSFYIDLSNSSQRALDRSRASLKVAGVVDRLARDISNATFLVKGEDEDPLSHPWFFVAESRHAFDGSDLLKFNARSKSPPEGALHVSDLVQVSYQTEAQEDGSLTLYRWSSPGSPMAYEPDYPSIDDDRSYIVAEGLGSFSLRFLDAQGEWQPNWDSTLAEKSQELPGAVEIQVSLWSEDSENEWNNSEAPDRSYTRQVILHQRPLDLNMMIAKRDEDTAKRAASSGGGVGQAQESQEGSGDAGPFGGTANPGSVADCTRRNWSLCVERYGEGNCGVWANVTEVPIGAFGIDLPWCN